MTSTATTSPIDDTIPPVPSSTGSRAGFVFGPRETRGLLLGLRGPQLAAILGGLAAVAAGLNRGPLGVLLGLGVAAFAVVAAFWPVAGRTVLEWAPVALGYAAQRAIGQASYRHPLTPAPDLPGPLTALTIHAVPVQGQAAGTVIGVVEDRRRGTLGAVAAVTGAQALALLDPADADRRISGWGSVLAGLARDGSPVRGLQWVARTVPDPGGDLSRFWAQASASGRAGLPTAAASYRALLDTLGDTGGGSGLWRHEVYVAVTVDARSGQRRRARGGSHRDPYGVLLREVAALQDRLAQCELEVAGWLPPPALARVLREAYEPAVTRARDAREPEQSEQFEQIESAVDPAGWGPMATTNTWTCFRSEDAWHATYWICEWPRSPVGGDFLTPLLAAPCASGVRRTVSVLAEPVDPRAAARATASARTAEAANQALRDRVGQLTTERTRAEAADVARRERELVQGHGDYRFLGLLTVTALTAQALDDACGQAEHDAHTAGLEVRRLYGEQDQAFAATLPLARGLR